MKHISTAFLLQKSLKSLSGNWLLKPACLADFRHRKTDSPYFSAKGLLGQLSDLHEHTSEFDDWPNWWRKYEEGSHFLQDCPLWRKHKQGTRSIDLIFLLTLFLLFLNPLLGTISAAQPINCNTFKKSMSDSKHSSRSTFLDSSLNYYF